MVRTNKYNCIKQKSTHRVLFLIELHNRILLVLVGAVGCSLRKNEITVLPSLLHPLAVFEGVADGTGGGYQAGDLATPAFG